ncbi:MAG TPA: type II toxin-antitoxin system PemK/MazF family toxin [Acidimicrobiia bacterium]
MTVNRGEVWMVKTPYGEKPHLVVSNQLRNRTLATVLCVRITSSPNPPALPSVVPIEDNSGSVVGRVLCDQIYVLEKEQLSRRISNGLTPNQMDRVCMGLRSALACL